MDTAPSSLLVIAPMEAQKNRFGIEFRSRAECTAVVEKRRDKSGDWGTINSASRQAL